MNQYEGFLIFTATSGTHKSSKKLALNLMPGFDSIETLWEDHGVLKNNLAGLPIKKKQIAS
jgi:hypothetical protein